MELCYFLQGPNARQLQPHPIETIIGKEQPGVMPTGSIAPQTPQSATNQGRHRFPRRGAVIVFFAILQLLVICALVWKLVDSYRLDALEVPESQARVEKLPLTPIADGKPRNIILMIADGAGLNHYAAARIHLAGRNGHLAVDGMPYVGLVTTHSADRIITDSAAAATAMASGSKTSNGLIGIAPDGKRLRSFFEDAQAGGRSRGIVVTTSVTDGTPAAFYAHSRDRSREDDIAVELADTGIELILGAGYPSFVPESDGGARQDRRDVLSELRKAGYLFARTREEFAGKAASPGKLLGLFRANEIAAGGKGPALKEMTTVALDRLNLNPKGFVLMVEGSLIDDSSHMRDIQSMMAEMASFDQAVAEALAFAGKHPDTLVIVTSDHECGGLLIEDPVYGEPGNGLDVQWNAGLRRASHTGGMVPLYAYGPGAAVFAGTYDNTDVARKIQAFLH